MKTLLQLTNLINYIVPSASVLNEPFTLDEVLRSIANLSVGICSGVDGIPAEFFKAKYYG